MEIRKRGHLILMMCIVAIALVAVVEIVYIHINKLDKPVFTESYIEVAIPEISMYDSETDTEVELKDDGLYYPLDAEEESTSNVGLEPGSDRLVEQLDGECQFELKYITNINDPIQVASIVFDEAPELNAYVFENGEVTYYAGSDNETGIQCGRYAVRTMYITIESDDEDQFLMDLIKKDKSVELNHATIDTCINGEETKRQKVDLGRIILTPTKSVEDILENTDSSEISKNEGVFSTEKYTIKKAVHIVSVDSPFLREMRDFAGIKIGIFDYTEATGREFNKGDVLTIKSWVTQPKSGEEGYFGYQLLPVVTFEDEEGNLYEHQILDMSYLSENCNYTSEAVRQYLKERGAI